MNGSLGIDFFHLSPDLIAIIRDDGIIRKINPAFSRIIGRQKKEILSRSFCDILPERDSTLTALQLRRSRHTGISFSFESRFINDKGVTHWIQWNVVPFKRGNAFYAIGRDITLLKQREEQLRISYAAMESAANGITLTDRSGIVTWVNSAFLRISGLTRIDIIGKQPGVMSSGVHDKSFFADLRKTVESGLVWSGEIVNRRPDGSRYTVEETVAPIRDNHGEITHFVSIMQDISERKEADRIIREHADLLQKQIHLAAEVQASLLPSTIPTLDGYAVAAAAIPAQYVSGDLYDYFPTGYNGCFFTVADISGKGVPAAMLASSMKTLVRSFSEPYNDPALLLAHMNGLLFSELQNAEMFITLCAVSLDISMGILRYAGAGHPEGIIIRRFDASYEFIPSTGLPLGVLETSSYDTRITHLAPGDCMILYSDGILEAQNDREDFFGKERFLSTLMENHPDHPRELVDRVVEAITDFRGRKPLSDDLTIVIIQGQDRTIPFSFNAHMENLEKMNELVRTASLPYGDKFSYHLELAASELFSNVIRHSHRHSGGTVRGSLTLTAGEVILDIYDNAESFDFNALPEPEKGVPREGGYGLPIVRELCDELVYTPGEAEGNHWHAVIRRKPT